MNKRIIKIIYIACAFVFFLLGMIGIILPIVPTTPFLLLASFCFARGSSRVHTYFTQSKIYQNHVHEFVETRAMTLKTKLTILLPASCMLIIGFIICPVWQGQMGIVAVLLFKYYYFFFRIKTLESKELA